MRNRRIKHSKALTLGIPRVRALLFIRKKTSLFFRCLVHDYAIVTVQWTHSVFRAYGGHTVPFRFAPTAFPKEANCKEFAFRSILEALKKHLANRHGTMFHSVLARQGGVNARALARRTDGIDSVVGIVANFRHKLRLQHIAVAKTVILKQYALPLFKVKLTVVSETT